MRPAYILFSVLLLTACAGPKKPRLMHTREFAKIRANCSNVDEVLMYLAEQKEQNNNRLLSAAKAVPGVHTLYLVAKGEYENTLEIASGDWEDALNAKIRELCAIRLRCREVGVSRFD